MISQRTYSLRNGNDKSCGGNSGSGYRGHNQSLNVQFMKTYEEDANLKEENQS